MQQFLGSYLLIRILQKKHPPKAIVFAHGAFAVLGILLILIFALTTEQHHKHWYSFTIFYIAAVVGVYKFSRDIRHKNVPKSWLLCMGVLAFLDSFGY
jgi:predicted membrane channel-forming protein YqfA (hemolysin III family)